MRVGRTAPRERGRGPFWQFSAACQIRVLLVAAALASTTVITGCAGVVGAASGSKPGPQVAIQVMPASLSFGSTVVGRNVSLSVSVTNTGNVAVNIAQASISGSQFFVSGLTVPFTLPVGQSAGFQVWFDATSAGTASGTLTVKTDTGVSSGPVPLTATAAAPQQISVSPVSLNLGTATVGTTNRAIVTISNSGGSNLTISSISLSGTPFGASGFVTPSTITPGTNAALNVTYSPTIAGSNSGNLTIISDDPKTPTSVISLSGTATVAPVAPSITTQPANRAVTAGQTATFTVLAQGTAPLAYQWQKNGINIAAATSASYTTPATTASDTGAIFTVVVSNAVGTVTSAAATLTVNPAPAPAIQVNPTSVGFGNVPVGTTSSQALIISNTGAATLNITQINRSGAAFIVNGFVLPLSLNPGQATAITVAFQPTLVGGATGNISIVSNAPSSPTSVPLSGTGIAATFTLGINPSSLDFGNVTTGIVSAPQTAALSNTGNSNVTISQIAVTGAGYSVIGGVAPVTLTPSQSLTLSVQFSPTVAGAASGSISIVSNATGSPAAITLSGIGVLPVQHSVALGWGASTSIVSGYNVYRSTASGSSYVQINSSLVTGLTYSDLNVQSGTTYYYVVTAVDSSAIESVHSNEASALIP